MQKPVLAGPVRGLDFRLLRPTYQDYFLMWEATATALSMATEEFSGLVNIGHLSLVQYILEESFCHQPNAARGTDVICANFSLIARLRLPKRAP